MRFLRLGTFLLIVLTARSAPTKEDLPHTLYDQKQKGDFNIQVHLKDIEIIALLGDDILGDYDYSYDYSDFTVKPAASNVTLKPEESSSTTENQSAATSTTEKATEIPVVSSTTTTEKSGSIPFSTSSPDKIKVQIIEDPTPNVAIVPSEDLGIANTPPLGEVPQLRRCANGYTRDKRGRCRRVRRPGHPQFNIGRLASNLASRIRGTSEEGTISEN